MKKTEYMREVNELRLSEEFKSTLKAKMLEEYDKNGGKPVSEDDGQKNITVSKRSMMYKYAAIAACLILAVSTVSVLSVRGIKSLKNSQADSSFSVATEALDTEENKSREVPETYGNIDENASDDVESDVPENASDSDSESVPEDAAAPEAENIIHDDEPVGEDTIIPEDAPEQEEVPSENDSSPIEEVDKKNYSRYASPSYNGGYNGDDYVNDATGTPDGKPEAEISASDIQGSGIYYPVLDETSSEPLAVSEESGEGAAEISEDPAEVENPVASVPEAPDGNVDLATTESTNNNDASTPTESPEEVPDNGENATVPEESSEVKEIDGDVPETYTEETTTTISDGTEAPLPAPELDTSVVESNPATDADEFLSYNDFSDYLIKTETGSLLPRTVVRFTVIKAYSEDELPYAAQGIYMDYGDTLYRVRITYDYLSERALNIERLITATGTESIQLSGRPVLSGEYIGEIIWGHSYDYPNASARLSDLLLYKIYNISGVDIAYQLTSLYGDNIDPGNTDMGLNPSESRVYTTSKNNPEIYVRKAAVSELMSAIKYGFDEAEVNPSDPSNLDPAPADEISASYLPGALKVSLCDLSELSLPDTEEKIKTVLEEMGAEIGTKSCNVITKDGNKAIFSDGVLTGLDIVSDTAPLGANVKGVTVGMHINDALKILRISGVRVDWDSEITLKAAEGWTAELRFEKGVLKTIKVRTTSPD